VLGAGMQSERSPLYLAGTTMARINRGVRVAFDCCIGPLLHPIGKHSNPQMWGIIASGSCMYHKVHRWDRPAMVCKTSTEFPLGSRHKALCLIFKPRHSVAFDAVHRKCVSACTAQHLLLTTNVHAICAADSRELL
jgi:hypothetical protein